MAWLNRLNGRPHVVQYEGDVPSQKYTASTFDEDDKPAAGSRGPAQIAPPLIPMTADQQRQSPGGAAVQYGGANPPRQDALDRATLSMIVLGAAGAWMWIRMSK